MKKPRMVRNIIALAVITRPQAPPSIGSQDVSVEFVTVELVGPMLDVGGTLANRMGRANADTTIPVVINHDISLQGLLLPPSSLYLRDIRFGIGERR
jgi:hypothetical protein